LGVLRIYMGNLNFTPNARHDSMIGINYIDNKVGALPYRHNLYNRVWRENSELIGRIQGFNEPRNTLWDLGGKLVRTGLDFKCCDRNSARTPNGNVALIGRGAFHPELAVGRVGRQGVADIHRLTLLGWLKCSTSMLNQAGPLNSHYYARRIGSE
jgi:hypothetical protein